MSDIDHEFGKTLSEKIKGWETNPKSFTDQTLEELHELAKTDFHAVRYLFALHISNGDVFGADKVIKEAIKNRPDFRSLLEWYAALYDEFSEDPNESIAVTNILKDVYDDEDRTYRIKYGLVSKYGELDRKQEQIDLYEQLVNDHPDKFTDIDKALAYVYSEIPEYYDRGVQLLREIKTEDHYPSQLGVNIGAAKFYAGEVYDGLIYHFGGEDFRPSNFVSKKAIPNSATANFDNKSIVITPYRGMGDSMILSRFIPIFARKFPTSKLHIATERPMIPLYKNTPGVASVGEIDSYAGRIFDHCLGVNMLTRYVRETIGQQIEHEWVGVDSQYNDKWKAITTSNRVVGINWKGSQRLGGKTPDSKNLSRDIPLEQFQVVIDIFPEITFICLNPDITPEELEIINKYPNVIIPRTIQNFGDTAGLINRCDIVVSIDTSVSTLSASMSKRTIAMCKYFPDYRWLHHQKWWDLSKVTIDVCRKPTYDATWSDVLFSVIKLLKTSFS